jgi:hypothetical protein
MAGQSVKLPFFTVGHSNRSLEEFIELLASAEIGLVADIRKVSAIENESAVQ